MKLKTRTLFQAGAVVLVLAIGLAAMLMLASSRREIARGKPPAPVIRAKAVMVKTMDYRTKIKGYGTVEPANRISLASQVEGKVVELAPEMAAGAVVKAGQELLRIDPADYRIAVTLAQARLADARSRLQMLEAEAREARREWLQLHPGTRVPSLAAKQPQLEAAQAAVKARAGELEKARLQLARTTIRAPFNALVESLNVGKGQYVSVGKTLAVLMDTSTAEIPVPLAGSRLHWFDVPGFTCSNCRPSLAEVRALVAGRPAVWQGRVVRAGARIDPLTRMVEVVVRVENPYGKKPPLAAGIFATVTIWGRTIAGAVLLPDKAVRQDDIVWVVDGQGRLQFQKVKVALATAEGVVVSGGLKDGQVVIVSDIRGAARGMLIRPEIEPNPGTGGKGR